MAKNRLTLYIFLALIGGILAGYFYNVRTISSYNNKIYQAETQIKSIQLQMLALKDTSSSAYQNLKTRKAAQNNIRKESDTVRESKLEYFTMLSDIFLRLIKMIVAPLVFSTLVVGVAKVGDIKAVGRIGGKTMLWFISATLVSLLLGMVLVNFFQPGKSMHLALPDEHLQSGIQKTALSLKDFLAHVFPKSFVEAMANNEILQIVVFSLFFGVATAAIGEKGAIIIKAMDAIAHIILKITSYVMMVAPLAVFGAMTAIVAKQGLSVIATYAVFISEFYFALIILWLVLVLAGFVVLKKRVFTLVNYLKDAMLIAFSTSTSEAAYPRTLIELERFGCKDKIVSFVLPLGYSFNLDGSMMYMTFASLFLAQSYNIHLSFQQQLSMLLVLMLTSKGVAGVPRASLVVIAGTIASFNIPEAGLALLIGIDPLLDMGRSATNVLGNAMATAVVSKWEGELEG
ncbi:dicarboxylate/amino acid:cation symporter [Mucilaginibacter arboris]|uniref:Cation:dicarboxylase symporter family transporter n=1 Tax=Mucilaginibacter arboris TaxID=2682090 RepID=A0A7K1SX61_9SPHI|nr:dicarboxylate/amino acid:cation symporter [Mucilaginibacter arboris]MVN21916.1 cation:dicarboxylase symporter family transporter [Mucilaginibacter arboris]